MALGTAERMQSGPGSGPALPLIGGFVHYSDHGLLPPEDQEMLPRVPLRRE